MAKHGKLCDAKLLGPKVKFKLWQPVADYYEIKVLALAVGAFFILCERLFLERKI